MSDHIVNQIFRPQLINDNTLHVIGVVSNFAGFNSRYRLFREWYQRMKNTPNVAVYVVEAAFGDHQFECTEADNPMHLQLRTNSEAWIKESMINCGIKNLLPRHWKYVCWCDTDVEFANPNWAQATLHQLQRYQVVQPFQQSLDLGFSGEVLQTFQGFGWMHRKGVRKQRNIQEPYQYCHSGYSWACTRRFFEALPGKGLIDWMILGSADFNMSWAMIGEVEATIYGNRAPSIIRRLKEWELAASRQTQCEVGYAPGHIVHHFHGPKNKRYYETRDQILTRCNFDPDNDLGYDEQGLIRIFNNQKLEHAIRGYNRSRSEDSVESY